MDNSKIEKNFIELVETEPVARLCNYFSPAPNRTWGPRTILDIELVYIASGYFKYNCEDHEYIAGKGDVIYIAPGTIHTLKNISDPDNKGMISCIHLELLPDKSFLSGDYQPKIMPLTVTSTMNDPEVKALFRQSANLFTRRDSKYTELLLSLKLKELWVRLAEYWENGGLFINKERTQRMLDFIDKNLTANISRQDIARKFNLTPEHINAIFRRELNTTPVAYIQRRKIDLACFYLAQEGRSIKETAMLTGYNDEFYFSRVFKKVCGYTPGEVAGRNRRIGGLK